MSIVGAFAAFLEAELTLTLGTDLFIGEAPSSDQAQDALWWLRANGGSPTTKLQTGERVKTYQVDIFYRDRNQQTVYDKLFALEELLNQSSGSDLSGFTTVEIDAQTFPIDNDLDDEDRKVGLVQANIVIYKENV